ncbi:mycofactocin biosynthesis peptidyl-dipeptidase MftE [Pseudonocardia sp. KRD291]|uniref:mycofactocin biosynthesis peptidyl-dipeptidase MftE n=1 Tax=Pseudonocardia sp. KRD291 TaxID=2792007 RepID=UPI001C4A0115|nr:mycofactocin biosynthesis peptidyl-dipeptidase MftE [Pseudonocardia sp. KRD291]MBW0104850.1 mycofactocin biosynthesis peptidyl-dipeptidase MftE [Pseudonocardia sp. KRD291]
MLLGDLAWTDLDGRAPALVVPVGSVEQHGPHLPLDTDVRVATAVASGVHDRDPSLVLAPALSYGAAGEHEGFPGTVSLGQEALRAVLVEYGRSACRWASRLLLVNGHGGNVATLVEAVALLRHEGRDAAWVPCVPPPAVTAGVPLDAHAGRVETSLMLALAPHLVRTDAAAPGATGRLRDLLEPMRTGGVVSVSPNGVLGDPSGASAEEGRRLLDGMVASVADAVHRWEPDASTGKLG